MAPSLGLSQSHNSVASGESGQLNKRKKESGVSTREEGTKLTEGANPDII